MTRPRASLRRRFFGLLLEAQLGLGRPSGGRPAQAFAEGLLLLPEAGNCGLQLLKVGRSRARQLFNAVCFIDGPFLRESLYEAPVNDARIWATCAGQLLFAVRTELHDGLVLLLAQEAGPGFICGDGLELLLCLYHGRFERFF